MFLCIAVLFFSEDALAAFVPDTGQLSCYNDVGGMITCGSPGQAFYGQDADYIINPMSFTKLDGGGNALPDSASYWAMVRDNVTGLIWEMKSNKDGIKNYNDSHDADNNYTWYDSNPATNGGAAGSIGTDTEAFLKALNNAHYGGYSDWRLPTIKELTYIVDYSINYSSDSPGSTINHWYFPDTHVYYVNSQYWSATTYSDNALSAWVVEFTLGRSFDWGKDAVAYVRAVRGGQSESFLHSATGSFDDAGKLSVDDASTAADGCIINGDGTVTETSSGLMWQQTGPTSTQTWEQALAYCEGLSLGGFTDWRMPNIKELKSLVDYSRFRPSINTNCMDTSWAFYWSSTSDAANKTSAWGVSFTYGDDYSLIKNTSNYVRAVRGGYSALSVNPVSRNVSKDAGVITFSVSNTGTGTMPWTAEVTSGGRWLLITSGNSGSNSGTIKCSYSANTIISSRSATIRITARGETGSPVNGSPMEVTVTQAPKPTDCTATLDGNLLLHIPYLSYGNPISGTQSFRANLGYEFNPTYPALILFKLDSYDTINNPLFLCAPSTLSDDLTVHIPDVLFPDGITHIWVDLQYSSDFSADGNIYFLITNYGEISN